MTRVLNIAQAGTSSAPVSVSLRYDQDPADLSQAPLVSLEVNHLPVAEGNPVPIADSGTLPVGVAAPAGATGILGGLYAIWSTLSASLPLPVGAAADGTDITGAAMPAGGVGIRGWLSAILTKLNASIAVTGTFYPATQPVSLASQPLPAGASTAALQPAINGDGGGLAHVTNFPATQPVSLAALPALAAGSAAIGTVGVTALPALPAGGNSIGTVINGAGTANIGNVFSLSPTASLVSLQQAASTSAAPLASHALVNGFVVKGLLTNAALIYVGGAGVTPSTGWPLNPGESVGVTGLTNTNQIYIVGANTTDTAAGMGN